MGLLQLLLDSGYNSFGNDIFIFTIFLGMFLLLMFRFAIPLSMIFVFTFLFVSLVGAMSIGGAPLIPETFIVLLTIVFGLILGMLTYFFFFRRA